MIIRDLLPFKNDSRRDDDEPPVSKETFRDTITLTLIDFDGELEVKLHFDDGYLFSSHTIMVDISADCVVEDAYIAG